MFSPMFSPMSSKGKSWVMQPAMLVKADLVSVWRRRRDDDGQTVAEYALVLLVAAAIAVAFLVWARQSGRLDAFFDLIFERLLNSVDEAALGIV